MHKKHARKNNRFFILCFYFFSRAENNREKQEHRKNKPVQKTTAKKHDPKKHFTIHVIEWSNCNEFINYFSNVIEVTKMFYYCSYVLTWLFTWLLC